MATIKETQNVRTIVARLMPGEDILEKLEEIVKEHNVKAGSLNLIGAIEGAHLGYFNVEEKQYEDFKIDEDLEVVSCMGNISLNAENEPVVHAHMVVANDRGECFGGHLMKGCVVSVTIEIIINAFEGSLRRARDDYSGLNLLNLPS